MSDDNKQNGCEPSPASDGSVGEPAAWALLTACGTAVLHTSCTMQGCFNWRMATERQGKIVPLYRSPALTDLERVALAAVLKHYEAAYDERGASVDDDSTLAMVRGLLERTK